MNQVVNPKLLRELARLVRAFEPADFEGLMGALQSDETRQGLLRALGTLAESSRNVSHQGHHPRKGGGKRSRRVPASIERLRESDAQKFKLLEELHAELSRKRLLSSPRQMADFCHGAGLTVDQNTTRSEAVVKLIDHLAGQPIESIEQLVASLRTRSTRRLQGGQLQAWADVIMRRSP